MARVSKSELKRRRDKQKEVDARLAKRGISGRGGKEIGTKAYEREHAPPPPTPTLKKREPIELKAPIDLRKKGFRNTKAFAIAQDIGGFLTGTKHGEVLPSGKFAPFPEGTLFGGGVAIAPNLGAIAGKGADLIKGGDAAVNQIISTVRSDMGGGILGTFKLNAESAASKLLTHTPPAGTPTITVGGKIFEINKIAGTAGQNFYSVANNYKNFALKKTYLQKLAATSTNPKLHLGILASVLYTSLFWAPNEKGDALITLTVAQNNALKNKDTEMVLEIDKIIQEVNDISASIPIIGFIQAEIAKFKAAAKASEVYKNEAEKIMEEQARIEEQGESDFEKERRESDEAAFERKREFREEETERFEDIREESEAREEESRTQKERETLIQQEVWRLRRNGQYAEADELELTIFK